MTRRLLAPLLIAVVGLALFVAETIVVTGNPGPTGLDASALDLADDLYSAAAVAVTKVITQFGSLPVTAVVVLIGAFVLARRGRRLELVLLITAAVAIYIAVNVIKAAVDRPRPPHPRAHAMLAAFPSGHAAYSTAYVAVALLTRRALVAGAIMVALVIGLTRLYLRVHWATDVLAGWALGAAIFGSASAMAIAVGRFRNNDGATCSQPSN